MAIVELVAGRCYSAPEIGAYWNKLGDKQFIKDRHLREYDVQGGIKRGKLKIVEEAG